MNSKFVKRKISIFKLLAMALTAAALLCVLPLSTYAAEKEITVTAEKDITDALDKANEDDVLTFVFGGSISLESSLFEKAKIVIPAGVTAVFTNTVGVDITLTREYDVWGIPFSPMVTVEGTLILQNNAEGGSITLSGAENSFLDQPMIEVMSGGSFVMNSGTITKCYGYCGSAVRGLAGSSIKISGGTLSGNKAIKPNTYPNDPDDPCKPGFGGAICAYGGVTISDGSFTKNYAENGGSVLYYVGGKETLLEITGGSFTENKAEGTLCGAVYVDEGFARIVGGTFANNTAEGLGGGIYVDAGAEVEMLYAAIYDNSTSGQGGAIYNCPTGIGEYQRFCGMTLYGNTAAFDGEDFFSEEKIGDGSENHTVYVSQYTLNGSKINWYKDTQEKYYTDGDDPAEQAYYQDSSDLIGLKSGASSDDITASIEIAKVKIYGNTAFAGAGIANNGTLRVGYSGLVIEKQVTGEGAPPDDVFEFTVEFSDGKTHDGIASGGTVSLKAGEKKVILDIPRGVTVTVTEGETENYTAEQAKQSAAIGDYDAALVFINNYEAASVTVTKNWAGDANEDQPSSVKVQLYNGGVSDGDPVELNDGNNWSYTFTNLNISGAWTVDEIDTPAGYIKEVTVEADNVFVITNTYHKAVTPPAKPETGSLTVIKTVTGSAGDRFKDFTFTVTLTDGSINGVYGELNFINGEASFTLRHNQSKTAAGLPSGIGYTVSENDNAGYSVSKTGEIGVILKDKIVTAAFVNSRSEIIIMPNPAAAIISVEKTLDGKAPAGNGFTFLLKDENGNILQAKQNNGGTVTFDRVLFSGSGTYTYNIVEKAGTNDGVVNAAAKATCARSFSHTLTEI